MRIGRIAQYIAFAVEDEAGGDDLRDDGDTWEVISEPSAFEAVRDAIKALGIEPASAQVAMIPQNYIKLEGHAANTMIRLLDALDGAGPHVRSHDGKHLITSSH